MNVINSHDCNVPYYRECVFTIQLLPLTFFFSLNGFNQSWLVIPLDGKKCLFIYFANANINDHTKRFTRFAYNCRLFIHLIVFCCVMMMCDGGGSGGKSTNKLRKFLNFSHWIYNLCIICGRLWLGSCHIINHSDGCYTDIMYAQWIAFAHILFKVLMHDAWCMKKKRCTWWTRIVEIRYRYVIRIYIS